MELSNLALLFRIVGKVNWICRPDSAQNIFPAGLLQPHVHLIPQLQGPVRTLLFAGTDARIQNGDELDTLPLQFLNVLWKPSKSATIKLTLAYVYT